MSKKSEAARLSKAKELAGNDGHEWGALDGAVQHSYFHAADIVIRPKHKTPLSKKHGHQHEVPTEEKKADEVTDGNGDDIGNPNGDNLNNPTSGSQDTSKPKRTRKSKAGEKTRENTK